MLAGGTSSRSPSMGSPRTSPSSEPALPKSSLPLALNQVSTDRPVSRPRSRFKSRSKSPHISPHISPNISPHISPHISTTFCLTSRPILRPNVTHILAMFRPHFAAISPLSRPYVVHISHTSPTRLAHISAGRESVDLRQVGSCTLRLSITRHYCVHC